jgi:hypothetical protein
MRARRKATLEFPGVVDGQEEEAAVGGEASFQHQSVAMCVEYRGDGLYRIHETCPSPRRPDDHRGEQRSRRLRAGQSYDHDQGALTGGDSRSPSGGRDLPAPGTPSSPRCPCGDPLRARPQSRTFHRHVCFTIYWTVEKLIVCHV